MPIFRGSSLPTLVKRVPKYVAETKTMLYATEYRGSQNAIEGLQFNLQARGLSYQIDNDGPVWSLVVDEPVIDIDEDLDRWEIYTESTEKSLFDLPDVVEEAEEFNDDGRAVDQGFKTYKKECEDAVDEPPSEFIKLFPKALEVIKHLRSGVTGWQLDLVGLRRTRKLEQQLASGFRINLDVGLLIYSTAQLNLPSNVAFSIPETPADVGTLYKWGWRKRSQRVDRVGNYVEQTVDLLFAPWSTLAYSQSPSALIW